MDSVVQVALIVGVSGIVTAVGSPALLAYLTNRQRRAEKAEDYARQDEVARRAAEAARLLAVRQDAAAAKAAEAARLLQKAQVESIARTDEVARLAAAAAAATDSQLRQIHTLVNSDMTAARQSELDQTRITLIMLRKVVALHEAAGRAPTADDLAAIETTEGRVRELEAILADRLVQMRVVEDEVRSAAAAAAAAAATTTTTTTTTTQAKEPEGR